MPAFVYDRPGYKLAAGGWKWNVQVPFLNTITENDRPLASPLFSLPEIPDTTFHLTISDHLEIIRVRLSCRMEIEQPDGPVVVKLELINQEGEKVRRQMRVIEAGGQRWKAKFTLDKEDINTNCKKLDGTVMFNVEILCHVHMERALPTDIDCSSSLSKDLEVLFDQMQDSDVVLIAGGREHKAHKVMLDARCLYFAKMFATDMREQNSRRVPIEDIGSEVLKQLLHFLYTGRVTTATMESMGAELYIAADRFQIMELKTESENYMLRHMSPHNCVILVLHGYPSNLDNPIEIIVKAVKFFRRYFSKIMSTEEWNALGEKNPASLLEIQKKIFDLKC